MWSLFIFLFVTDTISCCFHDISEGHEIAAVRRYFYVGGQYVSDGQGGHLFADQMYIEELQPVSGQSNKAPIIFIHGAGQTGTVD